MKKFIVLFAVLAMVFAFTPAAMADVSLYGSARMWTYSVDSDSNWSATGFDDRDTMWTLGKLARFGAKFTGGDVGGLFEMDARQSGYLSHSGGTQSGQASSLGNLRIRHLYGYWNFGGGQLLVGQTWPLTELCVAHLDYTAAGLQGYGGTGMGIARVPQIRLTFGNLKLAFLSPNPAAKTAGVWGTSDVDTTLPKVEVGYTLKLDNMKWEFVGGYQNYEEVNATDQAKDVTSYVLTTRGKMNFGALYVGLNLAYTQNGGNYGLARAVQDSAIINTAGTDIEDSTQYGGVLAVGYKVSDMVYIEGGYGMTDSEADWTAGTAKHEDTASAFYLTCQLKMAPGVYIKPEFAVFDKDDKDAKGVHTADEGKQTVFGVFWKINFK